MSSVLLWLTIVFLTITVGLGVSGYLPLYLVATYVIASGVAFLAYQIDKRAAQRSRQRTPESLLHLFALAGGWPGALIAQQLLRHKTKKTTFQVVFWITVLLNVALLAAAIRFL